MPSSLSGRMAHSVMEELRMVLLDFYQMKKIFSLTEYSAYLSKLKLN